MAKKAVRELVTIWGFEFDKKALEEMQKGVEDVKQSFIAVGAVVAAAGASIFGLVKSTSDYGDNLDKTSAKLGVSVEALQEFRFVADRAGVNSTMLDNALLMLNRNMGQLKLGTGEAREGIAQLAKETGTQVKITGNLERDFTTLIGTLSKVRNESTRAAIAEKFFGRQARDLGALLATSSEETETLRKRARALGGIMGKEGTDASAVFNDAMTDLMFSIRGIRDFIGLELMPAINALVDQYTDWIMANRELVKNNIREMAESLVYVFKVAFGIFKNMIQVVIGLARAFGGLSNAIKIVTTVLMVFMGLKFLRGMGLAVQGLAQLTTAWLTMGKAAMIAQLKLFAIPLAIGAIIAAIALIAEDIYTWTQGGDSVFGMMLNGITSIFTALSEKFFTFSDTVKTIIAIILTPIRALTAGFQNILDLWKVVTGKLSVGGLFKNALNRMAGIGDIGTASNSLASAFGIQDREIPNIMTNTPPANLGTENNSRSTVNANTKLEVNVQGLPPEEAQKAAENSITNVLDTMFRETLRAGSGPIER